MAEQHKEKIFVENEAQKILLDKELSGQISDGYWENACPRDHWIQWCNAEVVVRPEKTGINFFSMRTYDFASYELLKVVRTRMILYVRLAARFKPEYISALEHLFEDTDMECNALTGPEFHGEIPQYIQHAADKLDCSDYYKETYAKLVEVLSNADDRNYLENTCTLPVKTNVEGVYNLKALNKDLEVLKRIQHKHVTD